MISCGTELAGASVTRLVGFGFLFSSGASIDLDQAERQWRLIA